MRNKRTIQNARKLRTQMTDAEQHLWRRLRARQLHGHKFRRQHAVGPYITDFACLEAGLVIELDGGQHAEQQAKDDRRSSYLQQQGFHVLRFWNHDVLQQTDACLEVILQALGPRPEPHPQAGRKE